MAKSDSRTNASDEIATTATEIATTTTLSGADNPNNNRHQNNGSNHTNYDTTHRNNSNSKSHTQQPKPSQKSSLQRDKFCDSDFDKLVIDTSQKISREKSYNLLSELEDCCEDPASCIVQAKNVTIAPADNENCHQNCGRSVASQQQTTNEENCNTNSNNNNVSNDDIINIKQQVALSPTNSATSNLSSLASSGSISNLVEHAAQQKSSTLNGTKSQKHHGAAKSQQLVQKTTSSCSSPRSTASSINNHRTNTANSQPKRPMNAFMVWGQAVRRELHHRFSNVQNALLSKALGRVWRSLDAVEKEPYIRKANVIKAAHKRDYPNYRYQPRRIQERHQQPSHRTDCLAQSAFGVLEQQQRQSVVTSNELNQQQQVLQVACDDNNESVVNQHFSNGQTQVTQVQKFPNNFGTDRAMSSEQLSKDSTNSTGVCAFGAHIESPQTQQSSTRTDIKLECVQPAAELEPGSSERALVNSPAELIGRTKQFVQRQDVFERQQQMMSDVYQNSNRRAYFSRQLQEAPDCYSRTNNIDQYETNSNYYLIGPQYNNDNSNNNNNQHPQHPNHPHPHHPHHHQHQQQLLIDDQIGKAQALNQVSQNMPYHMEMNFTTTAQDASTTHHQFQQHPNPTSEHLFTTATALNAHHPHYPTTMDASYDNQFIFSTSIVSPQSSSLPVNGHNQIAMSSRGCDHLNDQINGSCLTHNHQHQNCT